MKWCIGLFTGVTVLSLCSLAGCGGSNYSRVNEKQDTPSDIKISQFNISEKTIELRFEYRTYVDRTLQGIKCEIDLNSGTSTLFLKNDSDLSLGAFSTELLNFKAIDVKNAGSLKGLKNISYSLMCSLNYDRGTEDVFEKSALHLIPGSKFSYR